MPIQPKYATKSICEKCGWSIVVKHHSDAILRPNVCKHCGCESLTHIKAGTIDNILASTLSFFGKR